MAAYRHIAVDPIVGALGAEIGGADIGQALTPAVVAEIRQAWLDHLVIFIPRQKLTPQALRRRSLRRPCSMRPRVTPSV